jgi:hypothetical protein
MTGQKVAHKILLVHVVLCVCTSSTAHSTSNLSVQALHLNQTAYTLYLFSVGLWLKAAVPNDVTVFSFDYFISSSPYCLNNVNNVSCSAHGNKPDAIIWEKDKSINQTSHRNQRLLQLFLIAQIPIFFIYGMFQLACTLHLFNTPPLIMNILN